MVMLHTEFGLFEKLLERTMETNSKKSLIEKNSQISVCKTWFFF